MASARAGGGAADAAAVVRGAIDPPKVKTGSVRSAVKVAKQTILTVPMTNRAASSARKTPPSPTAANRARAAPPAIAQRKVAKAADVRAAGADVAARDARAIANVLKLPPARRAMRRPAPRATKTTTRTTICWP